MSNENVMDEESKDKKKPTGFFNLFATTCEDIRDKAYSGLDMLN